MEGFESDEHKKKEIINSFTKAYAYEAHDEWQTTIIPPLQPQPTDSYPLVHRNMSDRPSWLFSFDYLVVQALPASQHVLDLGPRSTRSTKHPPIYSRPRPTQKSSTCQRTNNKTTIESNQSSRAHTLPHRWILPKNRCLINTSLALSIQASTPCLSSR